MSEIEVRLSKYEAKINRIWERNLSAPEKVWIATYEPTQERRMRFRLPEFEVVTKKAGHSWRDIDVTDTFAHWMAHNEYREEYFQHPDDLRLALQEFADALAEQVRQTLTSSEVGDNAVVAIYGFGSLFGLTRASTLIEDVAPSVRGRLLVFFPGHQEGSNYRLLDARDGWNYLAIAL